MPYDFFAFVLICVLVVFLLVLVTKYLKSRKRFRSKRIVAMILLLLLIIAIPLFGHSQINRQLQMDHLLSSFDQRHALSSTTDSNAVAEITALSKPLQYRILREEKMPADNIQDAFYDEYIEVNGQEYIVTLAYYTAPLRWTVFETYSLNKIKKIQ